MDDAEHDHSIPTAVTLARVLSRQPQPEIKADVLDKLKTCLLDFIACGFEARNLPWARQAAQLAESVGPCTIIGTGQAVGSADAAFANAVAGHGLVREDMHARSVSHLGVVVLPALLAVAEERGLSGRAFAEAAVLGYEVGAKVGSALVTPEFVRLFRPTGYTGPLAATAALCNLLRLDEDTCVSALALACNMVGGLNQWPHSGSDEMFFHPGHAAFCAIRASRLALSGARGSPLALDGEAGLLRVYRPDRQAPPIALFDGGPPEIMSVYLKPLPVCNFAQTPCQVALAIAAKERPDPSAIMRIRVRLTEAAHVYPGCAHSGPFERRLQAKMSIPFAVAAALHGGEVIEASFETLAEPERTRLAALVQLETDATFTSAFPAQQGASVTITLRDGTELSGAMADVEPATATLVQSRFLVAATDYRGSEQAHSIACAVADLENIADVGIIMRALGTANAG